MLGAFAYSHKARANLVLSVRMSVRRYQRGSYWKDLREISYRGLPLKFFEKRQIWFNSGKNNRHL
jgi:hypothetical protein